MFALGLPGFCTFLYVVRVLQAMQRTRVAFWLYLLENAVNVVLALALVQPLGVRGLALSLSIAYTVAAVVGPAWSCGAGWGRSGGPGPGGRWAAWWWPPWSWGWRSLVVSNLFTAEEGPWLLVRVVVSAGTGVVVYFGAAAVMARRAPAAALTRLSG